MALDETTMRDSLMTSMEEKLANFGDLSEDQKTALTNGLATVLANWLYTVLTTQAEVSFAVGTITGTDSHGDTPVAVTATGGAIT